MGHDNEVVLWELCSLCEVSRFSCSTHCFVMQDRHIVDCREPVFAVKPVSV